MSRLSEKESNDKHQERRLQELAIAAQKSPCKSSQRQIAIGQLITEIYRSPKLGHPQKGAWSANFYTDVYHEALQKTLLEVCQKIELYNCKYPVMAWVNFRLNKQLINVINDRRKKGITNIPKIKQKEAICIPNLANLEEQISVKNSSSNEDLLRQFIERDPERLLSAEFLQKKPFLTLQVIARAKLIEDRSWTEIATEFDVAPTTLSSFFYRRLKKLLPYFQKYLQE